MKQIMLCAVALLGACVNVSVQASNWEDGQKELYRVSRAFAHVHKKKSAKCTGRKKKAGGPPEWLSLNEGFGSNELPPCDMDHSIGDDLDIYKYRHHYRYDDRVTGVLVQARDKMPLPLLKDLVAYKSEDICQPAVRSYQTINISNQNPVAELEYLSIQEKMMLIVKVDLLPKALAYMVACYAQESDIPISYLMSDDVSPARKFEFTHELMESTLASIPVLGWIFKSNLGDGRGNSLCYRGLDKGIRGIGGLGVDVTDVRVKKIAEDLSIDLPSAGGPIGQNVMPFFIPEASSISHGYAGDTDEAMISALVQFEDASEAPKKSGVRKYNLEKMD